MTLEICVALRHDGQHEAFRTGAGPAALVVRARICNGRGSLGSGLQAANSSLQTNTLAPKLLHTIDAYWRMRPTRPMQFTKTFAGRTRRASGTFGTLCRLKTSHWRPPWAYPPAVSGCAGC